MQLFRILEIYFFINLLEFGNNVMFIEFSSTRVKSHSLFINKCILSVYMLCKPLNAIDYIQGYILKAKSNFTLLIYIYSFWILVSGILNVFNSY